MIAYNEKRLRLLVAIASHGHSNDKYLDQLVREYRSMNYFVDIVVVSNIEKNVAPGVQVVVGVPDSHPWSLPFAHKAIFAKRLNEYDLFLYSEDDILITEKNINAFLRVLNVMPEECIAGFLRIEKGPADETYYPEVHHRFHWEPKSLLRYGIYTFAQFTNEHAACYLLTREQLRQAIESGGYLVPPHQGKYDLLCTAATDPYTQCGFRKVVCISHLGDFLVHHLPNKYLDRMGTSELEVRRQVEALLSLAEKDVTTGTLFQTEPPSMRLPFTTYYAKSYYEPARTDVLSLVNGNTRAVLSVGCGWGETEQWLVKKGMRVVGIPLDPVIAACARARGVEVIEGDFDSAQKLLATQHFDCLLLSNVLHLVRDPVKLLASFAPLLSADATIIALVPNLLSISAVRERFRREHSLGIFADYDHVGAHLTSRRLVGKWFQTAGMRIEKLLNVLSPGARKSAKMTLGLMDPLLASEFVILASLR